MTTYACLEFRNGIRIVKYLENLVCTEIQFRMQIPGISNCDSLSVVMEF
jgi:hypothetical protein